MPPENLWLSGDRPKGEAYDAGWKSLAASGADIHGEASFVASFAPRSVLDAGCGTGRVAIELARRGIDVVGVDLDAAMLDAARRKEPVLPWIEDDLATVDLGRRVDAVVAAGNVMIFLVPGSEPTVIANLVRHLEPGGVLVAGFQLGPRSLSLERYDQLCDAAGLDLAERWSTWDREPMVPGGPYAVSVHRRRVGVEPAR